MAYRGDDLDLRTPQSPQSEFAGPAAPEFAPIPARTRAGQGRGAPIWVDDSALACCNHAYDVAAAHRALEVRLEHLVYALTRLDEAAEALELRGIRVGALRREAATAIATEIPAAPGNAKTNPRRADAFEEVLRLAAANAYRRQAPVAVGDIVYALIDAGIEFPSLLRLLPASPRPVLAPTEPALDLDLVRERVRNGPATSTAAANRGVADLASLSAVQAGLQSTRIDAIEQSIRTLTSELTNERKILSGVLQELQRELMAQREDTSRLGGITQDKIQAIFGDRLHSLEQAFHSARPGAGSEQVGLLLDKIAQIERALHSEIAATRQAIDTLAAKPVIDLGPLQQQVEELELTVAAERERATAGEQSLSAAIAAIAAALERQPEDITNRITTPVNERFDLVANTQSTRHAALTDALAAAQQRLDVLEEGLGAYFDRAADAITTAAGERGGIRDRVEQLSTGLDASAEQSRNAYARLTETLSRDLTRLNDGITKAHTNHQNLTTALDAQAEDLGKAFALVVARIDGLEKAAAKPVEMLQGLSVTVEKMHKLTVERYYRRNRFWYWLFGTDDWLAASWPSQSARIEEELRAIKH